MAGKKTVDTSLPSAVAARAKNAGTFWDKTLSALSALPQVAESTLGLPGDVQSVVQGLRDTAERTARTGAGYVSDSLRGRGTSIGDEWRSAGQNMQAREQAIQAKLHGHPVAAALHAMGNRPAAPTTADVSDAVNRAIELTTGGRYNTLYQPKTPSGRLTQDVVAGGAGALTGGGEAALGSRLLTGAGMGLSGGAAREAVHAALPGDHPYLEMLAQTLGSLVPGAAMLGKDWVSRNRATTPQQGEMGAVRVAHESHLDPEAAAARLRAYTPSPNPNINPTSAQVLGTRDAADLERQIAGVTKSNAIPRQRSATLAASGQPAAPQEGAQYHPMGTGVAAHAPGVFPDYEGQAAALGEHAAETASRHAAEQDALFASHEQQAAATRQSHQSAEEAARQAQQSDMATAHGAYPGIKNDAGVQLRSHLSGVNDALSNAENAAWSEARASGATVNREEATGAVHNYYDSLNTADQDALSPAMTFLSKMKNREFPDLPEGEMPVDEWLGFRSKVLGIARARDAIPRDSRALNNFAGHLGDLIDNGIGASLPDPEAAAKWREAAALTKRRYALFGPDGPAHNLVDTDLSGRLVQDPEKAVSTLLSGAGGTQNIRALRSGAEPLVNTEVVDDALRKHYAGVLTKDGERPIIPASAIGSELGNSTTRALAQDVPAVGDLFDTARSVATQHEANLAGLAQQQTEEAAALKQQHKGEIASLRQQHGGEMSDIAVNQSALDDALKLKNAFANSYANGPDAFKNFMDNNRDSVLAATDPAHHPLLDQLHTNAGYGAAPTGVGGMQSPALSAITAGDPRALIKQNFGPGMDRALGVASGAASLGEAALGPHLLGVPEPLNRGLQVLGAYQAPRQSSAWRQALERKVLGDAPAISAQRLEEAARTPSEMANLLETPITPVRLPEGLGKPIAGAMIGSELARPRSYPAAPAEAETPPLDPSFDVDALDAQPQSGEKPKWLPHDFDPDTIDAPAPQPHAAGGRVAFREGGKVATDIEPLVRNLINKVKKAKKITDKHTEGLLNHDDSAIVHALSVAKKAI